MFYVCVDVCVCVYVYYSLMRELLDYFPIKSPKTFESHTILLNFKRFKVMWVNIWLYFLLLCFFLNLISLSLSFQQYFNSMTGHQHQQHSMQSFLLWRPLFWSVSIDVGNQMKHGDNNRGEFNLITIIDLYALCISYWIDVCRNRRRIEADQISISNVWAASHFSISQCKPSFLLTIR